jgi:hypothetical protein
MKIAFGTYSIKLKSYTAEELALTDAHWQSTVFEVRQKVFHIFWIPVFSLQKQYIARKGNIVHEAPLLMVNLIQQKGIVKKPWYAFTLPLLLITVPILVGLYIFIAEWNMKRNRVNHEGQQYATIKNHLIEELHNLKTGAYLLLSHTAKNKPKPLLLQLVAVEHNEYYFVVKQMNFPKKKSDNYSITLYGKDTLKLNINDLLQAVPEDYARIEAHEDIGYPFLENQKFIITAVEYFDEPVIKGDLDWDLLKMIPRQQFTYYNLTAGYGNKNWQFKLIFQNFGAPARLVNIQVLDSTSIWIDSLPKMFQTYSYLQDTYVSVQSTVDPREHNLQAVFTFEDSLQQQYQYKITGAKGHYSIHPTNNTRKKTTQ